MPELTSEQLAQRISDCHLLDYRQLNRIFSDLGSRNAKLEDFQSKLLQEELLTNWQLQRLVDGHRNGYFYGNWKVLYLVGAGTFARVYRASHVKTADVKAVKVLRNRYTDDMVTRERFMREARMVMKLRHPNIVPIHEVDIHRGRIYMVMDFIEGQNLRDFVNSQKRVKTLTALQITRDVCSGLDYALELGVAHRDVKLSNILISTSGRASLVDFGLAADEDREREGVFNPRSVDYAGLEKTTDVPRGDKRSDIFFVGCGLYHMLCGQPPLYETRERMRRLNPMRYREIEPLSSRMPELPHRVINLVNRMLLLNPEDRIQTPRQAVEETVATIEAIKSGDTRQYDQRLTKQETAEYQKKIRKSTEGRGFTLMIIESNQSVQDVLRKRLKKLGYRVLIFSDPARGLERFQDLDPAEGLPASCLIVGCGGLGRTGLEAFNKFVEHPHANGLPAILMVMQYQMEDYRAKAKLEAHHRVIPLPIKFPVIRAALRDLLNIQPGNKEEEDEPEEQGQQVG